MKKLLLPFIAIAAVVTVVLVAQNTKQQAKTADAIEQAQFEAWKAANEKTAVVKKSAAPSVNYQSPKMISETQNTAKAKKGWSKAAKGAVIGAASGAVVGAVVNKRNRAAGAVIGGVIGGGGGYVIGRSMDKKDGRIQLN
jgi:CRISPR/Cas system CSM-associated protein Csm4 (group 5 of RAMP superfamily)